MPTTYAIPNGRTVMDATTYTGNGTSNTVVNTDVGTNGFKPDFVWIKNRTSAYNHYLYDSVRGANIVLQSNVTDAEASQANGLDSFTSTGYTINGNRLNINANGEAIVAWQWQAGQGTTSSNTSGSITSTVSVNATAGFSIVSYTGNGTIPSTIGHGLGVAPQFIIIKDRSVSSNWVVQHASLGWTQGFLGISTVAATSSTAFSNNTAPTSSVFTVGAYSNNNAENYIAYCWAPVAGFSQFGSYTGNGSADGPFIYLGFRPKFILIKNSSATSNWVIWDTTRSTYNQIILQLFPNTSDSEDNTGACDALSNGFKLRNTNSTWNGNGNTITYACFAENPFKYANAR